MNRRDKLLRKAHYETFVITLRSGESFEGLLADVDEKVVKLVGASLVDGEDRAPVDGDLYLPRENVLYLQNPGGRP